MSQNSFPCTCCGTLLEFAEDTDLRECSACGTVNARPRSTGDALVTLQRAIEQRRACDFHNAELSYQQVLLFRPDEHEALWGRLLCHYGVEYVEDPATRRRMPTVRTVRPKPIQEQADFVKACEFAPEAVREQYRQAAAYIDDAQAEIRQKARTCQPYDVFLCHKTTRPGSHDYTQDFHRATQLYHFLKDQGMRVFFAPECLQSAAGSNYEAGIYHALQTARVMLLVCSQTDYLTSAWVRSEWTRFLDLMDEDPTRQIVPLLYDHFSPSALPPQFIFRRIQGLDMTDINAPQTLVNLVAGAMGTGVREKAVDTPVATRVDAQILAPLLPKAAPVEEHPKTAAPEQRTSTNTITVTFPEAHPLRPNVKEFALNGATDAPDKIQPGEVITLEETEETTLAVLNRSSHRRSRIKTAIVFVTFILACVIMGVPLYVWGGMLIGGTLALPMILSTISQSAELLSFSAVPGSSYALYWEAKVGGQPQLKVRQS